MSILKVFTAFSGYDSQCLALNRLGIDYYLVGWSEIDKYAIQAHNALFPDAKDKNYGDISKIDWNEVADFDLFTMSSPCQDFSSAGLQKGGAEGSGTRSSLLWECRRAILAKKPKYILFENVKALVSQKFLPYFLKWQNELASYGYSNFAKVLNARDFGIPQNRERIFMVSILDENASYHFPEPFTLDKRLKDVLEEEVDEKYYLSKKLVDYVFSNGGNREPKILSYTRDANGKVVDRHFKDVANTIHGGTGGGGNTDSYVVEPSIVIGSAQKHAYVGSVEGISPCINAACGMGGGQTPMVADEQMFRIRKLTERECFRLMDVDDADIDKIQAAGISKTQQYKMAGNSIVVDVLYHIFRKLFIDKKQETSQLTLF